VRGRCRAKHASTCQEYSPQSWSAGIRNISSF